MVPLLLFGLALLLAVMLSGIARRSIVSTAVIFLLIGFFSGKSMLGIVRIDAENESLFTFVEIALVTILFTDGLKVGREDLISVWRLPGRALLLGLPLTLGMMAFLAHSLLSLSWTESFLVAAVLSPTDPVFTSAIASREEIPLRLRRLLNVESGLNDGIALPILLTVFALLGVEELRIAEWGGELMLGIMVGIAIPWLALSISKLAFFSITELYTPFLGLSIEILVYTVCRQLNANPFLAAFSAGVTVASLNPNVRNVFLRYGELASELLKLAGVLLFGALLSPGDFTAVDPWIYLFALLALLLVRPLAIFIALFGSETTWQERLTAGWFGPRGFASVVYGLLVLGANINNADSLFLIISVVVTGSILLHSSTDVIVARWYGRSDDERKTGGEIQPGDGGGRPAG